ncbi:MAG: DNA-processing protein DprA [Bacteroidota bacterium]
MSLIHKVALTLINSVGHITAKNLLGHFGSAEAIFKANRKELMDIPGIGDATAAEILNSDALRVAEAQLNFSSKHNVDVLFFGDENYPKRLMECYDAPVLLYYKGNADLNHHRIVSIVGTRKATSYGRYLCRQLAEVLAAHDVLIISGLAYGIDIAAHKESLNFNIPTVGVLAHGLDRIYPQLHHSIAKNMVHQGGLITEFPLGTNPDRENFPKRNRIIAGLADATIVVEATLKGGALITADIANSYDRDVYAFPGRTTDECSEGCNFLIKTNRAALINHAKDLVYYMGWESPGGANALNVSQIQMPLGLSKEEYQIIELLKISSERIDELSVKMSIPQSKLTMHLLNLEMQGILVSLPGKVYKLN